MVPTVYLLPCGNCKRGRRGSLGPAPLPRVLGPFSATGSHVSLQRRGSEEGDLDGGAPIPIQDFSFLQAFLRGPSSIYGCPSGHSCSPPHHSLIQILLMPLSESNSLHTFILSQSFPYRLPLAEDFSGFSGSQGQRSILLACAQGLHSQWPNPNHHCPPRPSSPARREHSLFPKFSLLTCLLTFALESPAWKPYLPSLWTQLFPKPFKCHFLQTCSFSPHRSPHTDRLSLHCDPAPPRALVPSFLSAPPFQPDFC